MNTKKYWQQYWKRKRFDLLSKRKEKYRSNRIYQNRIKAKANIIAAIDRLLKGGKDGLEKDSDSI